MAEVLSTRMEISAFEAERPEIRAAEVELHPVNRLRRHLSRTITQPRGIYEALVDAYGPISGTDDPQIEAVDIDDAYQNLPASDSSDTGTWSSHEDRSEDFEVQVREGDSACRGQRLRNRGRTKSQRLSDEEWAKSILGRRTGYGCLQRNQVMKYISQLETSLRRLQAEVLALSPQVGFLDQHRWLLQGENDALKRKIAEQSQYDRIKEGEDSTISSKIDQCSAFQNELEQLRIQQAQLERNSSASSSSCKSSSEGTIASQASDVRARIDVNQLLASCNLSDVENTEQEVKEISRPGLSNTSNRATSSPCQDDEKASKCSLVKWPSSLYRSVSAIRKDVLEVLAQETVG